MSFSPPQLSRPASLAILIIVFVASFGDLAIHYGLENLATVKTDLASIYAASVAAFGHGASPYDAQAIRQFAPGHVWPFLYPPQSLVLFYPLSLLSYDQADAAVLAANHVLLAILAWLIPFGLFKLSPSRHLPWVAAFLVLALHFYPVRATIDNGQVNLMWALGLVLFWICANAGREWPAAFFLGSVAVLKAYPALIVVMLFLAGRQRLALKSVAIVAAYTVIAAALIPPAAWTQWLFEVVPSGGYGNTPAGLAGPASLFNQSVNGLAARGFTDQLLHSQPLAAPDPVMNSPALGRALAYAVCGGLLLMTGAWIRRQYRNGGPENVDMLMMVTLPLMYLVAPISWDHHLTYLLPVLAGVALMNPAGSIGSRAAHIAFALALYWLLDALAATPVKILGVAVVWGFVILRGSQPLRATVNARAP